MTPRRLLVVSYFHPPFPTSGGNRWVSMGRHLRAAGHEVAFVASDAFGTLPDDEEQRVARARDLKSMALLRRVLRRGDLASPGAGAVSERPAPALLTRILVPDAHVVSWLPWAIATTRRLCASGAVDCLVTTGPPDSAHLVGLALGRRRPAWIADFRDGWSFEPLREPFPTRAQRRLDVALERRVARGAEGVVAATEPIAADLRRRFGIDARTVNNGYDPVLDDEVARTTVPALPSDRLLLVHTGALSGPRGRDSAPLLDTLARLDREAPDVAARLALVQVGPHSEADERRIAPLRERGLAVTLGSVPRLVSLALQRRADALLLITSDEVSQSTGKLYEYLAAGRPIIALADGNEAARIVRETDAGTTLPPADQWAIEAALRRLVSGDLARGFAPHDTERYLYPRPAEAIATLVEEALARRRGAAARSR
ncbi:MAG: glycosyltransferase [Solirubrobacteraceae bacterium]|nr:glycosyltransferase [Solirubrobacteraceae bacterium]